MCKEVIRNCDFSPVNHGRMRISNEDQEETDFQYGGQAQSILSNLKESIGNIDDFLSFERVFFLGDDLSVE